MTDDQGETTTSNQPKKPQPGQRKSRRGVLEKGLMAVIVPESSGSPGIGFLHYLLIKMISHSKKEVVGVTPPGCHGPVGKEFLSSGHSHQSKSDTKERRPSLHKQGGEKQALPRSDSSQPSPSGIKTFWRCFFLFPDDGERCPFNELGTQFTGS